MTKTCSAGNHVDIANWIFVYGGMSEQDAWDLLKLMRDMTRSMNATFGDPIMVRANGNGERGQDFTEAFMQEQQQQLQRGRPRFQTALFLLPTDESSRYNFIKREMLLDVPVSTQVVVRSTWGRPPYKGKAKSAVTNIGQQIINKLGHATRQVVGLGSGMGNGLMVCGIDTSKGIVAMTYSVSDAQTEVRVVFTTKDVGLPGIGGGQMKDLMEGALGDYLKENQALPKHVVVYRAGVSDGQKGRVLDDEVGAKDPTRLGCCGAFSAFVLYQDGDGKDQFESQVIDDYGGVDETWALNFERDHGVSPEEAAYRPQSFSFITYGANSGARLSGMTADLGLAGDGQLPVGTHFLDNICAKDVFLVNAHTSDLGAPKIPSYSILNFEDMLCNGSGMEDAHETMFPGMETKEALAELTFHLCHLFTNWAGK
jgi:hypothetical protein